MEFALNDPGFKWIHEKDTTKIVHKFVRKNAAANLSTWISVDHLQKFMLSKSHFQVMGRREEWFVPQKEETFVMWHVPEGVKPTFDEAYERLKFFRING
jgi:hypothetical protein